LKTGLVFAAGMLAACASGPPPPDWQADAKGALDAAVAAYLRGDTRAAHAEFARARGAVARTGRAELAARVELARCAAQVASVVFEPCHGFEALRADAPAAERAYADYLAARLAPQDAGLLPPQHRAVAAADADAAVAALRGIDDPLARLVAAGVLFQSGRAPPAAIAVAAETASAQGWRRPLAAWLNVQLALAERAGDAAEVQRLRRRLALVLGDR
jgi:hypothetical protein